jgi:Fe2+ or Zn2+ uptake regulation protein
VTDAELLRAILADLAVLSPREPTISTITKRLGGWPKIDGREVRRALDALVAAGEVEYVSGAGNNRAYRLAQVPEPHSV